MAAHLVATAVSMAPRATTENEKHAIPMEPRGESAKADFAASGATSVAGRVQPPRRRLSNKRRVLFSGQRRCPTRDENDRVFPRCPATAPPTRRTWHPVDTRVPSGHAVGVALVPGAPWANSSHPTNNQTVIGYFQSGRYFSIDQTPINRIH